MLLGSYENPIINHATKLFIFQTRRQNFNCNSVIAASLKEHSQFLKEHNQKNTFSKTKHP